MIVRPRRLRQTPVIRNMVAETHLSPDMLVYPVFIREGHGIIEDIPSL
ncbi:MAG: porphobilinogen synthase, partial [Pyramidobacter sp.]|nr:porphobilinogen synthase [Pyramidobacter sp.]